MITNCVESDFIILKLSNAKLKNNCDSCLTQFKQESHLLVIYLRFLLICFSKKTLTKSGIPKELSWVVPNLLGILSPW